MGQAFNRLLSTVSSIRLAVGPSSFATYVEPENRNDLPRQQGVTLESPIHAARHFQRAPSAYSHKCPVLPLRLSTLYSLLLLLLLLLLVTVVRPLARETAVR